jgi:hypothetical protein
MKKGLFIILVSIQFYAISQCDFVTNNEIQVKCLDYSNGQFTYWNADYYFSTNQTNLTYQWYLNGNQLQSGSNSGEYSGVTTLNSFGIYGSVPSSLIGSTFYCVIRNSANCLDTVFLTLGGDPTDEFGVTQYSENAVVGQSNTSSQQISVNQANVYFQWSFNGINNFLTDNGHYSGTNSSQLNIYNILNSDEGNYLCLVSSSLGCKDTISFDLQVCENYGLTQQPTDVYGSIGQNVNFNIVANNVSSYSWEGNFGFGFQTLSNAGQFAGVNTNILNIQNISQSNNNSLFRCKISNNNGCGQSYLYSDTVTLFVQTNNIEEFYESNITFFPNPANDKIKLNYNLSSSPYIYFYGCDGKLVMKYCCFDSNEIDVSEIPNGTYFINFDSIFSKLIISR